jgi:hypothetical protein
MSLSASDDRSSFDLTRVGGIFLDGKRSDG